MGHLLSTVNPEAAERLANPRPLPEIGATVRYCPRPAEIRAGKAAVPALVVGRDEPNALLDLVIVFDCDDFMAQREVPERIGTDRGWERLGAGTGADAVRALEQRFENFQDEMGGALFGDEPRPEQPLLALIADLALRIAVLEAALGTAAPASADKPARARGRRAGTAA